MKLLDTFARVTKKRPCPLCGRDHYCMVGRDNLESPSVVICTRVESSRRWGNAGWFHRLRDDGFRPSRVRVHHVPAPPPPRPDFDALLERARDVMDLGDVSAFADQLGVSPWSLLRLGIARFDETRMRDIGYSCVDSAWAFPMRDENGVTIGVRLRLPNGSKRAITGSRAGLIYAPESDQPGCRLVIAEGESDCAALLDLGLRVVGRPGCTTCTELVIAHARRHAAAEAVVMADGDHAGQTGAIALARRLRLYIPSVRVVTPPGGIKDAREWRRRGLDLAGLKDGVESGIAIQLCAQAAPERSSNGS